MLISEFNNINIAGVVTAVPTQKVPIESHNENFGEETVAKFSEMTGVKSVCQAVSEQTASDLGYEAANFLIKEIHLNRDDIGLLVFVTQKPDYRTPSTAFILHGRLGLSKDCCCFDINLACSGYIYGLHTVFSMLQNSDKDTALLITGDTSRRTISPLDRTMVMLFGDAGSATIIKREDAKPTKFALRTDGSRYKAIITPSGAYRNMYGKREPYIWGDGIMRSDYHTQMKGMDVFGFSITDVPKLMKDFLIELNRSVDEYDCFALHQANIYILKQIQRKLKIPNSKMPVTIDRFGNTSCNSIPLVLSDAFGEIPSKEIHLFLGGFGAGLSWAVADIFLNTNNIYPVIYTDRFWEQSI